MSSPVRRAEGEGVASLPLLTHTSEVRVVVFVVRSRPPRFLARRPLEEPRALLTILAIRAGPNQDSPRASLVVLRRPQLEDARFIGVSILGTSPEPEHARAVEVVRALGVSSQPKRTRSLGLLGPEAEDVTTLGSLVAASSPSSARPLVGFTGGISPLLEVVASHAEAARRRAFEVAGEASLLAPEPLEAMPLELPRPVVVTSEAP